MANEPHASIVHHRRDRFRLLSRNSQPQPPSSTGHMARCVRSVSQSRSTAACATRSGISSAGEEPTLSPGRGPAAASQVQPRPGRRGRPGTPRSIRARQRRRQPVPATHPRTATCGFPGDLIALGKAADSTAASASRICRTAISARSAEAGDAAQAPATASASARIHQADVPRPG